MRTAALLPAAPLQPDPQTQLADELRHVRDLVFLRGLFARGGATAAELREYDDAIDAARAALADSARSASRRFAA